MSGLQPLALPMARTALALFNTSTAASLGWAKGTGMLCGVMVSLCTTAPSRTQPLQWQAVLVHDTRRWWCPWQRRRWQRRRWQHRHAARRSTGERPPPAVGRAGLLHCASTYLARLVAEDGVVVGALVALDGELCFGHVHAVDEVEH